MRDETYRPTPDGASGRRRRSTRTTSGRARHRPDVAIAGRAQQGLEHMAARGVLAPRCQASLAAARMGAVRSFHVRDCYAFPRDSYLAAEAALLPRKVQETVAALEHGGAILRATIRVAGKRRRVIYPGAAVVERAARTHRGASSNKRKNTPRAPRTPARGRASRRRASRA